MTDTLELELAIKWAKLTKRKIAEDLGISEMALYNKLNNISEFKASEIRELCKKLDIKESERSNIFFNA